MFYSSLVLLNFNYADVAYGPCIAKAAAMKIQRVQNSCTRTMVSTEQNHI